LPGRGEKKGWRQASILREVSVGTIKMMMLVISGLRKDGDKSLDGPLQLFHHIYSVEKVH